MAAETKITPIIAIPPRSPELHWDLIHRLREELSPLKGVQAPVWIHPTEPNLSTEPEALPERAYQQWQGRRKGERFALSGYTGAPLSALTDDEMRRELEWAAKNPWGAGAKLYGFDEPGTSRAPSLPDPDRTKVAENETFLLAIFERERQAHLLYSTGDLLRSLPILRLSRLLLELGSFKRELSRFLRRCRRRESPGLLLLEVDSAPGGVALLKEAVQTVTESRALSQRLRLAPFPAEQGERESEALLTPALLEGPLTGTAFDLALHRGLRQAAAQRSLPGLNRERQRKVLAAFREEQPAEERNRNYGSRRVYSAAMHGSAEIIGDTFSVRTEGGRPSRLVAPAGSVGLDLPAQTTLRFPANLEAVPRELCRVESVTAFSFESPLSRGIREESAIEGSLTGRSRLDSYFLTDYQELFVALELTLAGSLEEDLFLTPVEFPLSRFRTEELGEIALRRTLAKDRTVRDIAPLRKGAVLPLFGSELALEGSGIFPGLRCGSADLWQEALVPSAVALLSVGTERRRRVELSFAPFGVLRLRKGTLKGFSLRRTVRLKPFDEGASFTRLSRDLEEELLLWEGREG